MWTLKLNTSQDFTLNTSFRTLQPGNGFGPQEDCPDTPTPEQYKRDDMVVPKNFRFRGFKPYSQRE